MGTTKVTIPAVVAAVLLGMTVGEAASGFRPNRIAISYVAPENPAHRPIYQTLKNHRVLERFKKVLSPIRLPRTLLLKTSGCGGDVNAWYDDAEHTVTVCYEYLEMVHRNAPEATTQAGVTREDAITGPATEVFLHETAHALFDLLRIPILGREEDAADQLAAYLLLQLDGDAARRAVSGVAFMYTELAKVQKPGLRVFADDHGLPAQRFFNLLCMAYGAKPDVFGDCVSKGYLPASRAEFCGDEYGQVEYAYRRLISPYVDRQVRKKAQASKRP